MPMAESSAAHLEKTARSAHSRGGTGDAARPDASAAPETTGQAGQFGPLPLVLRPAPAAEGEGRRDRRGSGKLGRRSIILYWLTGTFLGVVLAWALASALAQQQKSADPKPAAPAKSAPAASPKPQQQQSQQQPQAQQPSLPRHNRTGALSDPLDALDAQRRQSLRQLHGIARSRRARFPGTQHGGRRVFPTCGGAISTFTARRCWRRNSPPFRRATSAASCT